MKVNLHVDVVIGAQHPCREQIQDACIAHGYVCHVQTLRMAEIMSESDLAIGAGGTVMWERCCLGLPAIAFSVAENQSKQIADAAEAGLLYSPTSHDNFVDMITFHLSVLLENPALLKLISNVSMKIVDAKGTTRIVSSMAIDGINMRKATIHDSQDLFNWRNHPKIRAASKDSAIIEWKDHQKWFGRVVDDTEHELLIGVSDDCPVGVVRFDKEGDAAEVSIYIVPDSKFVGQGRKLLLSAENWLKANRTDIKKIRASVLGENMASQSLFLDLNYLTLMIYYQKVL
jgi:hypothetical protein